MNTAQMRRKDAILGNLGIRCAAPWLAINDIGGDASEGYRCGSVVFKSFLNSSFDNSGDWLDVVSPPEVVVVVVSLLVSRNSSLACRTMSVSRSALDNGVVLSRLAVP